MPLRFRFSWPLAVVILVWALNYIALKEVYKQLTASEVAFLRYLVMYAALAILCVVNRESFRLPKVDAGRVLFFGFCSLGVYLFLFLEGMRSIAPAEGAILLNLSPILTMLLAASFGLERLKAGALGGAIVAFVGIILVMIPGLAGENHNPIGYVLILSSALMWAFSTVLMKPLLAKYSPLRLMTLSIPGAFPVMLAYWLIKDHGHMPLASITPFGWLMFGHVALLSGVAGFLLFYRGVHEVGASEAAAWIYFVPPLTVMLQWALTGVALKPLQILGMVIVLLGVATAQQFRSPAAAVVPPIEPA